MIASNLTSVFEEQKENLLTEKYALLPAVPEEHLVLGAGRNFYRKGTRRGMQPVASFVIKGNCKRSHEAAACRSLSTEQTEREGVD